MRNREDKKCKKGQESTIGKIIYGFLLFMPLLAIGVTCITAFWNKEVTADTQTAEIQYEFNTNEVETTNDLIIGNTYQTTIIQNDLTSPYKTLYCSEIIITGTNNETIFYKDVAKISPQGSYLYVYRLSNNGLLGLISYYNGELTIGVKLNSDSFDTTKTTFDLTQLTKYTGDNPIKNVNITTTPQNADVKNVFYYAVDKVTESTLFNWAENSIIYTTTSNTCNALSITTPFIPLLLAYWLIISVIYFLYDIALMLVWIIHRKIHEMQESI